MMKDVIDVSQWNDVKDWSKFKDMISGVIIRVGYGSDISSQDDWRFRDNVKACRKLGIPIPAVYLYGYANTDQKAHSEAAHALRLVREMGLPKSTVIFYDAEENSNASFIDRAYRIFYTDIMAAGYPCGLYTGVYYYNAHMSAITWKSLWIPAYGNGDAIKDEWARPKFPHPYDLWQYSSAVRYPGIVSGVDTSEVIRPEHVFLESSEHVAASQSAPAGDPVGTTLDLVYGVMTGKYGAGLARKAALGTRYDEVQGEIDHIDKTDIAQLAKEAMGNRYGTDAVRKAVLGKKWEAVQKEIMRILAEQEKKHGSRYSDLVLMGQQHSVNFTGVAIVVDGLAGDQTRMQKIRVVQHALNLDYQRHKAPTNLLNLTGEWDALTDKIFGNHYAKRGEKQYLVTALEILLMLNGYDPKGVECPGIFGSLEDVVKRFQKDHGLVVDGCAGRQTFKELIK